MMIDWAELQRAGFEALRWELAVGGLAVLVIGMLDKVHGRGFAWLAAVAVVVAVIVGLIAGSGLRMTWGA